MSKKKWPSWYRESPPKQTSFLFELEDADDVVILPQVDNSALLARLNLSLAGWIFHQSGRSIESLVSHLCKKHLCDVKSTSMSTSRSSPMKNSQASNVPSGSQANTDVNFLGNLGKSSPGLSKKESKKKTIEAQLQKGQGNPGLLLHLASRERNSRWATSVPCNGVFPLSKLQSSGSLVGNVGSRIPPDTNSWGS